MIIERFAPPKPGFSGPAVTSSYIAAIWFVLKFITIDFISGREDSNPQPPVVETGALTN